METKRLEAIFRARAQELLELYEATKELPEASIKGMLREELISRFLAEFMPKRFGIGSRGIIVSADGSSTEEVDIIIYDEENLVLLRPLTLWLGGHVYPSEAVYMMIEVESSLSSRKLERILEKLVKAKKLPREACYLKEGAVYDVFNLYGCEWRIPPLLSVIFAYDGEDPEPLAETVRKYIEAHSLKPCEYPDLIVVLSKGYIAWSEDDNRIAITPTEKSSPLPIRSEPYQTLGLSYAKITQLLGQLKLPPISVFKYMRGFKFGELSELERGRLKKAE